VAASASAWITAFAGVVPAVSIPKNIAVCVELL
jgi:hypothetical protein